MTLELILFYHLEFHSLVVIYLYMIIAATFRRVFLSFCHICNIKEDCYCYALFLKNYFVNFCAVIERMYSL